MTAFFILKTEKEMIGFITFRLDTEPGINRKTPSVTDLARARAIHITVIIEVNDNCEAHRHTHTLSHTTPRKPCSHAGACSLVKCGLPIPQALSLLVPGLPLALGIHAKVAARGCPQVLLAAWILLPSGNRHTSGVAVSTQQRPALSRVSHAYCCPLLAVVCWTVSMLVFTLEQNTS